MFQCCSILCCIKFKINLSYKNPIKFKYQWYLVLLKMMIAIFAFQKIMSLIMMFLEEQILLFHKKLLVMFIEDILFWLSYAINKWLNHAKNINKSSFLSLFSLIMEYTLSVFFIAMLFHLDKLKEHFNFLWLSFSLIYNQNDLLCQKSDSWDLFFYITLIF